MRRTMVWTGVAVTLALVVLAVRAIDLGDVWQALRASEIVWLWPSLLLLGAAVVLRAARWRALFDASSRPGMRAVTAATVIGYFFNNLLPLRAGEAARIVALHARSGVSRTQIAATVALDRVYDVVALLVVFAASVPFVPDLTWVRTAAWFGGALAVLLALAVVFLLRFGERGLRVLLWPLRWVPFISLERWEYASRNAARGLVGLTNPRVAGAALAWTLAAWIATALSSWVLMFGFDLGLPPAAAVLVVVATGLGMLIPSAPAGLGVFEAAIVVALAAYGVAAAPALSYALVLHAVNFVPFLLAGAIVIGASRIGRPARRAT